MKKLLSLFVLILLFTFTWELSVQGQNLTSPTDSVYYSPWKSYVNYVFYIRPDSVTMDASRFIFTPTDTLQSFSQAGRPNPLTPQSARWLWFYEFISSLQLGDSVIVIGKLSLQIAPTGVVTYLRTSFYNKHNGNAYFSEGKMLADDHSLQKYVWVISKDVQQRVGDGITTMSMDI